MCSIGDSAASVDQSPFQTPEVSGCSARGLARPREHLRQQRQDERDLVRRFLRAVAARVGVVRLVPDVPAEHARVLAERADDTGDVRYADAA